VTDVPLKVQIHDQMNAALKGGEKTRLGALRMLMSAVRYKEDELGHEASDEEVRAVATKEVKKRTEAAEAFRDAGRDELADKEEAERAVIAAFAPDQLSAEEVDALIEDAIGSTGATSMKQMGQVMGEVMGRAQGRVDGSIVQEKVKARLQP
jgi:uncharacterized protein YqeY